MLKISPLTDLKRSKGVGSKETVVLRQWGSGLILS